MTDQACFIHSKPSINDYNLEIYLYKVKDDNRIIVFIAKIDY